MSLRCTEFQGSWLWYWWVQGLGENSFVALENLSDGEDTNSAWENINESNKTSAKDSLGL